MTQALTATVDNSIARDVWGAMLAGIVPRVKVPICDWVQSRIDLSYDHTSAAHGLVRLRPYQVEPMTASEDPDCREITLMWGQRLGKSSLWKFHLVKRVYDGDLSGIILYPSKELGLKTNQDTVLPLLKTLREAKKDLNLRGGKKKDSYHLPSLRSVIYFQGGGAQVISSTANWAAMDEADFVKLEKADEEGKNMDQLKALRLRMQTARDRLLWASSSPTSYGGTINENWKRGSRGVWNLRCLKCGEPSPGNQLAFLLQDGTYAGLQWAKDEGGSIIRDSLAWICPHCRRRHTEAEAAELNEGGLYIHANDDNRAHRSYQAGALSNPELWTWMEIAEAQEDATNPDAKKFLRNTILGMPYKHVREGDISISIHDVLDQKRQDYPADLADTLSIVVAGVDQQKSGLAGAKYYIYCVRGWDEAGNSWQLASGLANSLDELGQVLSARYYGLPVALALIDQGGFENLQDLDPFVAARQNAMYYKGDDERTLKAEPWAMSKTSAKLILANAIHYQVRLLDLLYGPPRPEGYRWAIPMEISPDYLAQVGALCPNSRMRNGDAFANWKEIGRRDYFDAEKMAIVALDVACHFIPPDRFRFRNKPLFVRREIIQSLIRSKKLTRAV